jgi:hypothetical protein
MAEPLLAVDVAELLAAIADAVIGFVAWTIALCMPSAA